MLVRVMFKLETVLVKDLNVLRAEWKIAQVVNALRSKNGKVRDVLLRYKVSKPGNKYTGQGDINVARSWWFFFLRKSSS